MTPVLVGRDLHKSFGFTEALRGASITLDEGEIVAVMGPSGSGKSTLLHCLAGILTPDFGEVHFAGRRIDQLPDRERAHLRRTVFGFVFQFGQLVPELPAMENIALPLLLAGRRRRRRSRRPRLAAPAGPRRARRAAARRAVRRRGPADRAGAGAGREPEGRVRRRAHGRARLGRRRPGHGAARRRRARAGHQRHDGDARGPGGRLRRPDGDGARRRRCHRGRGGGA